MYTAISWVADICECCECWESTVCECWESTVPVVSAVPVLPRLLAEEGRDNERGLDWLILVLIELAAALRIHCSIVCEYFSPACWFNATWLADISDIVRN
jgi:hypothetical protein